MIDVRDLVVFHPITESMLHQHVSSETGFESDRFFNIQWSVPTSAVARIECNHAAIVQAVLSVPRTTRLPQIAFEGIKVPWKISLFEGHDAESSLQGKFSVAAKEEGCALACLKYLSTKANTFYIFNASMVFKAPVEIVRDSLARHVKAKDVKIGLVAESIWLRREYVTFLLEPGPNDVSYFLDLVPNIVSVLESRMPPSDHQIWKLSLKKNLMDVLRRDPEMRSLLVRLQVRIWKFMTLYLIGDSGSGKTALLRAMLEQKWKPDLPSTHPSVIESIQLDASSNGIFSLFESRPSVGEEDGIMPMMKFSIDLGEGIYDTTFLSSLSPRLSESKRPKEHSRSEPVNFTAASASSHSRALEADLPISSPLPTAVQTTDEHDLRMTKIVMNVWDFGGQHEYYNIHQLFLVDHAICLIVLDVTSLFRGEHLRFWLRGMRCRNRNIAVLAVITKCDKSNEQEIRSRRNDLKAVLDSLKITSPFYYVSASTGSGILDLKRGIHHCALKQLEELVNDPKKYVESPSWGPFLDKLLEDHESYPVKDWDAVLRCWPGEHDDASIVKALSFFSANGQLFYIHDEDKGKRVVVTQPQFIVDMPGEILHSEKEHAGTVYALPNVWRDGEPPEALLDDWNWTRANRAAISCDLLAWVFGRANPLDFLRASVVDRPANMFTETRKPEERRQFHFFGPSLYSRSGMDRLVKILLHSDLAIQIAPPHGRKSTNWLLFPSMFPQEGIIFSDDSANGLEISFAFEVLPVGQFYRVFVKWLRDLQKRWFQVTIQNACEAHLELLFPDWKLFLQRRDARLVLRAPCEKAASLGEVASIFERHLALVLEVTHECACLSHGPQCSHITVCNKALEFSSILSLEGISNGELFYVPSTLKGLEAPVIFDSLKTLPKKLKWKRLDVHELPQPEGFPLANTDARRMLPTSFAPTGCVVLGCWPSSPADLLHGEGRLLQRSQGNGVLWEWKQDGVVFDVLVVVASTELVKLQVAAGLVLLDERRKSSPGRMITAAGGSSDSGPIFGSGDGRDKPSEHLPRRGSVQIDCDFVRGFVLKPEAGDGLMDKVIDCVPWNSLVVVAPWFFEKAWTENFLLKFDSQYKWKCLDPRRGDGWRVQLYECLDVSLAFVVFDFPLLGFDLCHSLGSALRKKGACALILLSQVGIGARESFKDGENHQPTEYLALTPVGSSQRVVRSSKWLNTLSENILSIDLDQTRQDISDRLNVTGKHMDYACTWLSHVFVGEDQSQGPFLCHQDLHTHDDRRQAFRKSFGAILVPTTYEDLLVPPSNQELDRVEGKILAAVVAVARFVQNRLPLTVFEELYTYSREQLHRLGCGKVFCLVPSADVLGVNWVRELKIEAMVSANTSKMPPAVLKYFTLRKAGLARHLWNRCCLVILGCESNHLPADVDYLGTDMVDKRRPELYSLVDRANNAGCLILRVPPGNDLSHLYGQCYATVAHLAGLECKIYSACKARSPEEWSVQTESLKPFLTGAILCLGGVSKVESKLLVKQLNGWKRVNRVVSRPFFSLSVLEKEGVSQRILFLDWEQSFWGDLAYGLVKSLCVFKPASILHLACKVGITSSRADVRSRLFVPAKFSLRDSMGGELACISGNCLTDYVDGSVKVSLHASFPSPLDESQEATRALDDLDVQSFDCEGAYLALGCKENGVQFGAVYFGSDYLPDFGDEGDVSMGLGPGSSTLPEVEWNRIVDILCKFSEESTGAPPN